MNINEIFQLNELRRNSIVNFKQSSIEVLKKYAGQKDVFVSFTSDVGKDSHPEYGLTSKPDEETKIRKISRSTNTSGHKLGINPKTTYDTPTGIYAYPIDYVLELNGSVPFAGKQPFIQVFQVNMQNMLDLENYSDDDLEEDSDKLAAYIEKYKKDNPDLFIDAMPPPKIIASYRSRFNDQDYFDRVKRIKRFEFPYDLIDASSKAARVKTSGGRLWNITRVIANSIHSNLSAGKNAITIWNKLFRMLGYDGAIDLGEGIIHENEPTQAIFFSLKGIKVLETIRNIKPAEKKSVTMLAIEKPQLFLKWLYAGKLDISQISHIMRQSFTETILEWDKLPEWLQKSFILRYKHWVKEFPRLLKIIPLTETQVLELITEKPQNLLSCYIYNKKLLTPAVYTYVADNMPLYEVILAENVQYVFSFKMECSITDAVKIISYIIYKDMEYIIPMYVFDLLGTPGVVSAILKHDPKLFIRFNNRGSGFFEYFTNDEVKYLIDYCFTIKTKLAVGMIPVNMLESLYFNNLKAFNYYKQQISPSQIEILKNTGNKSRAILSLISQNFSD